MSTVSTEPDRGFNLKDILINYRFLIFNALFVVYILFGQRPLLELINRSAGPGRPSVFLAVLMFAVVAAEAVGIHLKFPAMLARAPGDRREKGRGGCILFVIWVFHMVVNMFLMIYAVMALGMDPGKDKESLWLFIGLSVFSVLKDLYLMFYAQGFAKPGGSDVGEFAGDALIFIWGAVAYTSTWIFLFSQVGFFRDSTPAMLLIEVVGVLLIFCMFFLPIQVVYFHEQAFRPRGWRHRLGFWLGFAATAVSAMLSLVYRGERW